MQKNRRAALLRGLFWFFLALLTLFALLPLGLLILSLLMRQKTVKI